MSALHITRRSLLRGLFASPAIITYGHLMPVAAMPLPYMQGDLINFHTNTWRLTGWYARTEPLLRVEGNHLIFREWHYARYNEEVRIPSHLCSLFEGLPGNRVNNPSMRHRLIREPGRIGLRYPEDEVKP